MRSHFLPATSPVPNTKCNQQTILQVEKLQVAQLQCCKKQKQKFRKLCNAFQFESSLCMRCTCFIRGPSEPYSALGCPWFHPSNQTNQQTHEQTNKQTIKQNTGKKLNRISPQARIIGRDPGLFLGGIAANNTTRARMHARTHALQVMIL